MCTPSISVGQFRLVKTAEAPHDTIHLYLVPPEFAGDALKRLRFSEDMPLRNVTFCPFPRLGGEVPDLGTVCGRSQGGAMSADLSTLQARKALAAKYGAERGISAALVAAVIEQESSWNPSLSALSLHSRPATSSQPFLPCPRLGS